MKICKILIKLYNDTEIILETVSDFGQLILIKKKKDLERDVFLCYNKDNKMIILR